MGIEFVKIKTGECILCGGSGPFAGEHKIKASLIRSEFGNRSTVIAGIDRPRIAQSSKSRHFYFKNAPVCRECNSSRTQTGDIAFDTLHMLLRNLRDEGFNLTDAVNYLPDEVKKESHRYFAKILCCFLAEVGGPKSKSLSSFAIGRSHCSPITLTISEDDVYEANLVVMGAQGEVSHGGLAFIFDDQRRWIQWIRCSLSAGGIHYDFRVQLGYLTMLELHFKYGELVQIALENIIEN